MKTFKDLVFEPHPLQKSDDYIKGVQALSFFDNGYGVSVVRFKLDGFDFHSSRTNSDNWEVAILKKDNNGKWSVSGDPIGYLNDSDVSELMIELQGR